MSYILFRFLMFGIVVEIVRRCMEVKVFNFSLWLLERIFILLIIVFRVVFCGLFSR